MRKVPILIILSGVCLLSTAFLLYFSFFEKKLSLLSPLPSFLQVRVNKEVSTIDLWLPALDFFKSAFFNQPEVNAKSALIFDLDSQKILYSKNPKERLPMASLTKIMTAIIALEHPKKGNKYLVTKDALVGENSMGLTEGEVVSLEDLLYGLILPSGNDAAETLASHFPGGREGFIRAMNDKAKSLGLMNTHFTNPSGLEGDGDQYTTAYDLLVITRYALSRFPLFGKVVATYQYAIPYTSFHKEFYLENETNLLTTYPGVKGVKTGFTPEAGLCLVTYLEYKNHKIIGVLLGGVERRETMKSLLDYSLKSLGVAPPKHG